MKTLFAILLLSATAYAADVDIQKSFKLVTRKDHTAWSATAFFISPTRLLTAAHTFKHGTKDYWIVKDGREVHCTVLKVDTKQDIALIESDEVCASFYRLAGSLKVVGFPFGQEAIEAAPGRIDSKWLHAKVYFVPGMSGAPLVNDYGDVEGMGVEDDGPMSGHDNCKAIPASVLAEFVKGCDQIIK